MAHLIDKDAVLAIIDKFKHEGNIPYDRGLFELVCDIESDINSIEVREMDLEKEIKNVQRYYKTIEEYAGFPARLYSRDIKRIAEYFFEYGVNASNPLTWEDMMFIHRCIKDAMNFKLYKIMEGVEGQKEVYEEVLKRFKERKMK